jgi:preprotein translocase subunit SecA
VGDQERRERAAQGRGAQLRHQEESARVRRRDELAAQDRVHAAQALLVGRYTPEEIDEVGKPIIGKTREIPVDPAVEETVTPMVAQLVGMFCDPPVQPIGENGKPRSPSVEEIEQAQKLVDLEALQHEVYQLWGIRLDLEKRKKRTPLSVYEELADEVPQALTEQRERLLDLIDREISAIVEESCPENRPPEDWDWKSLHEGFREHFKVRADKNLDPARRIPTAS